MKRREKLSISIFSNQYYSKHYLRMMYSKTILYINNYLVYY